MVRKRLSTLLLLAAGTVWPAQAQPSIDDLLFAAGGRGDRPGDVGTSSEPLAEFERARTAEGLPLQVMLPNGPSAATVILAHGCGGYAPGREVPWARAFRARGMAAVTFDSWGFRAMDGGVCQTDAITGDQRVEDVKLVVRYLKEQHWHRGPIYIIGWSHGGQTALKASTIPGLVDKAVAIYPWCEKHHAYAVVPTQIHMGGADNWTPAYRCSALYGGLFGLGANPNGRYYEYAGAYHDFDRWMPLDKTYDGRGEGGRIEPRRQKTDPEARALTERRVLEFFSAR